MSHWDEINRHTAELVRLTLKAADQGPEPLPEDQVAQLGMVIAIERQLLIDAMSGLLDEDEPEAAASPGVAEFDAGFLYGLAFADALADVRMALDRVRRAQILKLAKGNDTEPLVTADRDRPARSSRQPTKDQNRRPGDQEKSLSPSSLLFSCDLDSEGGRDAGCIATMGISTAYISRTLTLPQGR